jgi:glycine cleavage system T protein (aminomethyltransferase)
VEDLRHSPLEAEHRALGAHLGAFAGWDMPISYSGTVAEHTAVRTDVGVFDVSHLGKILVGGAAAAGSLDTTLTNRIADLAPGRARYTLLLDEDAGIVDDMIVYALAEEKLLVVPNAANVDDVEARIRARMPGSVRLERSDWAVIAIQGPRSRAVLDAAVPGVPELKYMRCATAGEIAVARSGYTGEHGYEVLAPPEQATGVWRAALAAGAVPCGLAARDTLRLEMGYPLHGNDIDRETTPKEAGLAWAVAEDKEFFAGKEAYVSKPVSKTLVGLRMEDRIIPRRGCAVMAGDRAIGTVTSGTFSPTLKIGIALAWVEPGSLATGDACEVEVRGKRGKAVVVDPPFVASSPKG